MKHLKGDYYKKEPCNWKMVRGFVLNLELYNAHADTECIIRSASFSRGSHIAFAFMEIANGMVVSTMSMNSLTAAEVCFFLISFSEAVLSNNQITTVDSH